MSATSGDDIVWIFAYGSLMWDGWESGVALCERTIHLRSGGAVAALVTIYAGSGLVQVGSVDETAAMACRAVGSAGRCIDYVRNVASSLGELGISDPAVADLLAAVDRAEQAV